MKEILFISLGFLSSGCGGEKVEEKKVVEVAETPKSVLMIIAHENFRDEEFKIPFDHFTELGHHVTVASTDTTPAKGALGLEVKPDIVIEGIDTLKYDCLVLVGGPGSTVYWDDQRIHRLANHFFSSGKILAAICIAPVTLARAGVLKGYRATVFETEATRQELEKGGALFSGSDVEIDRKIITASGPSAARTFADAISLILKEEK